MICRRRLDTMPPWRRLIFFAAIDISMMMPTPPAATWLRADAAFFCRHSAADTPFDVYYYCRL